MTTQPKLCALCNTNPVGFNGYVCEDCFKKAQYQAKANLALVGSEQYEWGIVMLTPGTINHIPADSELVGVWHKYGEGTFWVSLNLPLQALMDRATLLHAEVARRRELELPLLGRVTERKVRVGKPKEKAEIQESTISKDMQALRDRLRPKT